MSDLTREQILAMKPGRELDALVAEKVMGWKRRQCSVFTDIQWLMSLDTDGQDVLGVTYRSDAAPIYWQGLPDYSTSIAAAWEVVEKVTEHFAARKHRTAEFGCHQFGRWWKAYWTQVVDTCPPEWHARCDSLPEAICKASLLAVMGL